MNNGSFKEEEKKRQTFTFLKRAYKKVENAFVSTFMAKEGESVEDAKARMAAEQQAREEKMKADAEAREAAQKAVIEKSLEASRNAGKRD